jgi:hypothetical protein
MNLFKFTFNLNMSQVIQLRALTGACSSFTSLYEDCAHILREYKVQPVVLSDYGHLHNARFQAACDIKANEFNRPTVTIGNKKYYEDELTTALANIKEVK